MNKKNDGSWTDAGDSATIEDNLHRYMQIYDHGVIDSALNEYRNDYK
jgi:hypothetical protein